MCDSPNHEASFWSHIAAKSFLLLKSSKAGWAGCWPSQAGSLNRPADCIAVFGQECLGSTVRWSEAVLKPGSCTASQPGQQSRPPTSVGQCCITWGWVMVKPWQIAALWWNLRFPEKTTLEAGVSGPWPIRGRKKCATVSRFRYETPSVREAVPQIPAPACFRCLKRQMCLITSWDGVLGKASKECMWGHSTNEAHEFPITLWPTDPWQLEFRSRHSYCITGNFRSRQAYPTSR